MYLNSEKKHCLEMGRPNDHIFFDLLKLKEEVQKSKYKPCSKEHSKHDNDCKDCVAVNGYKYKEKKWKFSMC